ncbi:MAG: malonyl-CoA synthase [Alphaproteobacteria bacterium]|nr:malonyl-CoA synthase [Alphaproteobacteria bacterium]
MSQNLYHTLSGGFPQDRSATVFVIPGGGDYSFAELEAGAGRIAALLRSLDVDPGDRVMAQVDKSPEAVFLYLACLRIGAIYLPLNTAYRETELEFFISDAEPSVIVCEPGHAETIEALATRLGDAHVLTLGTEGDGSLIERSQPLEPATEVAETGADDIAAICYTSGTTGRSKGAMLSHANLASNAQTLHKLWGFVPGDVLLHALPIFHVHGLFVALHCALLNGSKVIFLPRFDADEMVRQMPNATVMMGVPTFYVRLLAHPRFTREVCANMRLFIAGSAPLLAETFAEFEARTGHRVLERYGMTEAGMVTSNPYEGERRPGKVGRALPGVELRVADEDGRILPPGEVGVLEYKGPNVFKGYWRMPEKTKEEFRPDGFFISGDLATLDEDGTVTIVGRAKDLIISGGFNVYPKEVEGFIDELDGVGESAVVGLPHPDFGEAVAAVVTAAAPTEKPDEAEIIATLKDRLASFKVPKRVFVVDELPRNTMGKVQKTLLRERYAATFKETTPAG